MLYKLSRWFEQPAVPNSYSNSERLLLCVILTIGALVRFWGLGNVGLQGDEETMAIPAMAILREGEPILPSGMYYSRALLNIYLMAAAVSMFGESEWSFRLPSAIVGSLMPLAAFFLGRRFLPPSYNLAFVAAIALLPGFIEFSQEARMYVFFVTALIWFGACLFRWERDGRFSSLLAALVAWCLALHFQQLAIFAAPLFLFPGVARQSWRRALEGSGAFLVGYLIFTGYVRWMAGKYPDRSERPSWPDHAAVASPIETVVSLSPWILIVALTVFVAAAILLGKKATRTASRPGLFGAMLMIGGLLLMAVLHFYVGGLLLVAGSLIWYRTVDAPQKGLGIALGAAAAITVLHLAVLSATGEYPGRRLLGALVGEPSVWPVINFLSYTPGSGILFGVFLAVVLGAFAKGEKLPVHFLFFAMAVAAPLFAIGYFKSYPEPRYMSGQIGYFLLCCYAGIAYLAARWSALRERSAPTLRTFVLIITTAVVVNPVSLAQVLNPDYSRYPDHKGAAEYIQGLNLDGDAILIAEDILQQTYYLGYVHYSLRPFEDAIHYSVLQGDQWLDQYTGVPVIRDGAELSAVMDAAAAGAQPVYIIGSGENWVGDTRPLRSRGIAEVLASDRLEVVYEGRDKRTVVWKLRH